MDSIVHGVTKSQTRLNEFHLHSEFKGMALKYYLEINYYEIFSRRFVFPLLLFFRPLSLVQHLATPRTSPRQAPLSCSISQSLLEFMSIELVMLSNHLIFCCLLLYLFSISPSIRVFSSESALHIRWPKDSSFSFSISPSNEYSGLIAFRIDWFDLLAWIETLNLPQHHSLKEASIHGA